MYLVVFPVQESDISAACIPCCAVVANWHLFLCHEDLYSKFHRTLTRLSLGDVMTVALGESNPTYCVIVSYLLVYSFYYTRCQINFITLAVTLLGHRYCVIVN